MKSDARFFSGKLSDDHIIDVIRSSTDDSVAFNITSEWGFDKLKHSIGSRGDTFDRAGAISFEENGQEILHIPVSGLPATIGSGTAADYVIKRPGISRLHCHLEAVGSLVRIIDDQSTNGLLLNKKMVETEDLCDGDELTLGTTVLRIRKT